jgi:hypothetical protein
MPPPGNGPIAAWALPARQQLSQIAQFARATYRVTKCLLTDHFSIGSLFRTA